MSYLVNATTGATSEYVGMNFTSLYTTPDGKVYDTAADGIYELTGDADGTAPIEACVAFGKKLFGTQQLKHTVNSYVGTECADKLLMRINGFEYLTRSYDSEMKTQRFDTGRGLRSNYFLVELYNVGGGDFDIDVFEMEVTPTGMRI